MSASRWERAEVLLERALELPPARRGAFLRDACGDDAELRAEVESLVAAAESAEGFLEDPAAVPALGGEEADADLEAGARVEQYRILRELGRGGMGVVYEAEDTRLGRRVALKFLPPWLRGDPSATERFVEEARAASATDHPNIATLYEIGETEDGRLFLAMPRYEGETLRARLDRGPLGVDEAVAIGRQVAAALAAAHGRGIVHRDIKPANLFLTDDGWVKVLDFGVAKVRDVDLTGPGVRLGTAAYMSPDQAGGDDVDARTDIWSLGVVMHEMLAGTRPFRGDGERAVLRSVLEDPPPPLGDEVPEALAAIVRRCLARDPEDRFPGAAGLEAALERLLPAHPGDGVPRPRSGSSRRSGAPGSARERWRRIGVGVAAAVAVALVAVLATVWVGSREGADGTAAAREAASAAGTRIAVLPFTVRGDPAYRYLSEGMVDLLSAKLSLAGEVRPVDPFVLLRSLHAEGSATAMDPTRGREVASRFDADAFVLGTILEAGGRLEARASLYGRDGTLQATSEGRAEEEGGLLELVDHLAWELVLEETSGGRPDLVRVAATTTPSFSALKDYLVGESHLRRGRFADAIQAFRSAVTRDTAFALAHYRMAVAAGWIRENELSLQAAERAMRHADRLAETDRLLLEAYLIWPDGVPARVEALYRTVLRASPDNAEAWQGLGEVLFHYNPLRGRSITEAREPFRRAYDLLRGDHAEPLIHLADLAAYEGHPEVYDTLFRQLHVDSALAVVYGAQHAFVMGSPAEKDRVLRRLSRAPSRIVRHAVARVTALSGDYAGALGIARLLHAPERSSDWRGAGRLLAATLEAGRGRWTGAARELSAAEAVHPGATLLLRAYLAAHPVLPVPAADVEAVRARLEAWEAGAGPGGEIPTLAVHEGMQPQLRLYLLGRLSGRLGEADAVERYAAALAEAGDPPGADSLSRDLALGLRAEAARLRDRSDEALDLLLRARVGRDYEQVIVSPFFSQLHERWLRAELLRELGHGEDAAAWYRAVSELFFDAAIYAPPARLRRAEVLEALGRPEAAARDYATFVRAWSEADPGAAPLVEGARERLRRLREGKER